MFGTWREDASLLYLHEYECRFLRSSETAQQRHGETDMTRLKKFGAVALLSMMTATPVFAQAAIQEPGAFAFYHPNADVLNAGAPTPAASAGAFASVPYGNGNAYAYVGDAGTSFCARHHRSYDPASGTFLGYDGARHSCR
jgi:hypothetical protein